MKVEDEESGVERMPLEGMPAKGTPAVRTPADGTPVVRTPAEWITVKGTPAVRMPAVGTLAVRTAIESMSAEWMRCKAMRYCYGTGTIGRKLSLIRFPKFTIVRHGTLRHGSTLTLRIALLLNALS